MQIETTRGNLGRWNIITQTGKCSGCWINNLPTFFKSARHFWMVKIFRSFSLNFIIIKYFKSTCNVQVRTIPKISAGWERKRNMVLFIVTFFSSFYSVEESYTQVEWQKWVISSWWVQILEHYFSLKANYTIPLHITRKNEKEMVMSFIREHSWYIWWNFRNRFWQWH